MSLKRVITAFILVPVVLYILLYAEPVWLLAAISLITLLALLEYNKLTATKTRGTPFDALMLVLGAAAAPLFYWCGTEAAASLIVCSAFVLFLAGMIGGRGERVEPGGAGGLAQKDLFYDTALKTLGIVYIALPMAYFLLLRKADGGKYWIFFLLGVIWINDSMAYISGRLFGRHKMSPVISPNKTIEGAAGGIIFGGVAAVVLNHYLDLGMGLLSVVILSVVIGVVAIIGDLVESVIKRGAGVKDSGSIIPGHGGVLDRIDSIIFTVPVLYYYLLLYYRTGV